MNRNRPPSTSDDTSANKRLAAAIVQLIAAVMEWLARHGGDSWP